MSIDTTSGNGFGLSEIWVTVGCLHNRSKEKMNDPFDWRNYKPQISLKDLETSRRAAYQASRVVNQKRLEGVEPSTPYAQRTAAHIAALPKSMTVEMPKMESYRKRRGRK
jgi:hypothetical protein